MKTNRNRKGRVLFAAGILLWSLSLMLKSYFPSNQSLLTGFIGVGVVVEIAGMIIVQKNGGFKNKFCRKNL